jgi:hypothetical protein
MNGFIAITRFPTSTYYILVQDMPKECGFIHEAVWETGAGFPSSHCASKKPSPSLGKGLFDLV